MKIIKKLMGFVKEYDVRNMKIYTLKYSLIFVILHIINDVNLFASNILLFASSYDIMMQIKGE